MKHFFFVTSAAVLMSLALSGCPANEHSEQTTFSFAGNTLNVTNSNANMPVAISTSAEAGKVLVKVRTHTKGKRPGVPAWSLNDDILNLGTPCNTGYVGYCEATYSVQVPQGTRVLVNGQPKY